ncbi:MAG: hypothetical protein JWN48_4537 [Myxococcaceae bacterium]|nr:hypothetical protein [Myxococcaceae bacterium]
MSELSSDAKSLVEAGRAADEPSIDDKARLRKRLAAELGAGVFAAAAVAATPSEAARQADVLRAASTRSAWRASRTLKWFAAAGSAAAVYVAAVALLPAKPAVAPPRADQAAPCCSEAAQPPVPRSDAPAQLPVPATNGEASSSAPAPHNARSAPTKSARRARKGPAAVSPSATTAGAPADSLSAELALLAQAQRALRVRDANAALRVVQEHAAQFPRGQLQEERAGIAALAYCQLGQKSEPAVSAFLVRAPHSPVAARVRKECGL